MEQKNKIKENNVKKSSKDETLSNTASLVRTTKTMDEVIEAPVSFKSKRLESKQQSANSPKEPKKKIQRKVITTRFNKTLAMIRRRLVRRLNASSTTACCKRNNANSGKDSSIKSGNKPTSTASFKSLNRSQLRPDDLNRRRFPVPPPRRPDSIVDDDDGVTIRRRDNKPTIIFLHGFGSSADVFESQLNYFSNLGYPCLAPDMLGHGFSSAPRKASCYYFDKLLKDLEVLLLHYAFKPGQKCVIVAHNYG